MEAILKSKMAAHLVELVFVGTHSPIHNTHFDIKIGLLSLLEVKILAKHWFNMAAILKSKMATHLVELVFTGTYSLTHSTHFDTKMGLLSLLEAKILGKHWFNMAAILKSKMAAHLVELVFAGTHSLTHYTHFDSKMGLLSLLEAKILAKHWFKMAAILKSNMAKYLVKLAGTHSLTRKNVSMRGDEERGGWEEWR